MLEVPLSNFVGGSMGGTDWNLFDVFQREYATGTNALASC